MPSVARIDVATPALCVDLDRMESNIRAMAEVCKEHGIDWRPHAKCHKSPIIAKMQVEAGAIGVTCATVREVEIMAKAGIDDILLANLVGCPRKLEQLAEVARQTRLVVCFDSLAGARRLSDCLTGKSATVRALIEVEIGFNRVGVPAGEPAVELAEQIATLPGIELAGVMAYEGHLLTIADPQEKAFAIRSALEKAVNTATLIRRAGHRCPIVSCGGTGSFRITSAIDGVTELQAGGAIFMDNFYRNQCGVLGLEQALMVVSTVVSRPIPERAVMDAGRKALDTAIDQPTIVDRAGVSIDWLAAEHGVLKVDNVAEPLQIGDQLVITPGYGDLTTMLHRRMFGLRNDEVECVIPIES